MRIKSKYKINFIFDWKVNLKRKITFTKGSRKKLEIKTIRTKLKNIIPIIWIEW